jgi:hypothetical protein
MLSARASAQTAAHRFTRTRAARGRVIGWPSQGWDYRPKTVLTPNGRKLLARQVLHQAGWLPRRVPEERHGVRRGRCNAEEDALCARVSGATAYGHCCIELGVPENRRRAIENACKRGDEMLAATSPQGNLACASADNDYTWSSLCKLGVSASGATALQSSASTPGGTPRKLGCVGGAVPREGLFCTFEFAMPRRV